MSTEIGRLVLTKFELTNIRQFRSKIEELGSNGKIFIGQNASGKSTQMAVFEMMGNQKGLKLQNLVQVGENEGEMKIFFKDEKGNDFVLTYHIKQGERQTIKSELSWDMGKVSKKDMPKVLGDNLPEPFDIHKFMSNQGTTSGKRKNAEIVFHELLGIDLSDKLGKLDNNADELKEVRVRIKHNKGTFTGREFSYEDALAEKKKLSLQEYKDKVDVAKRYEMQDQQKDKLINHLEELGKSVMKTQEKFDSAVSGQMKTIQDEIDRLIGMRDNLREISEKDEFLREDIDLIHKIGNTDVRTQLSQLRTLKESLAISTNEFDDLQTCDDPGFTIEDAEKDLEDAISYNARVDIYDTLRPQALAIKEDLVVEDKLIQSRSEITESLNEDIAKVNTKEHMPEGVRFHATESGIRLQVRASESEWVDAAPNTVNTAKLMEISVFLGIKMLQKNKLRLMTIRDASLLDADTMERIFDQCLENKVQLFMEVVESGMESMSLEIRDWIDFTRNEQDSRIGRINKLNE